MIETAFELQTTKPYRPHDLDGWLLLADTEAGADLERTHGTEPVISPDGIQPWELRHLTLTPFFNRFIPGEQATIVALAAHYNELNWYFFEQRIPYIPGDDDNKPEPVLPYSWQKTVYNNHTIPAQNNPAVKTAYMTALINSVDLDAYAAETVPDLGGYIIRDLILEFAGTEPQLEQADLSTLLDNLFRSEAISGYGLDYSQRSRALWATYELLQHMRWRLTAPDLNTNGLNGYVESDLHKNILDTASNWIQNANFAEISAGNEVMQAVNNILESAELAPVDPAIADDDHAQNRLAVIYRSAIELAGVEMFSTSEEATVRRIGGLFINESLTHAPRMLATDYLQLRAAGKDTSAYVDRVVRLGDIDFNSDESFKNIRSIRKLGLRYALRHATLHQDIYGDQIPAIKARYELLIQNEDPQYTPEEDQMLLGLIKAAHKGDESIFTYTMDQLFLYGTSIADDISQEDQMRYNLYNAAIKKKMPEVAAFFAKCNSGSIREGFKFISQAKELEVQPGIMTEAEILWTNEYNQALRDGRYTDAFFISKLPAAAITFAQEYSQAKHDGRLDKAIRTIPVHENRHRREQRFYHKTRSFVLLNALEQNLFNADGSLDFIVQKLTQHTTGELTLTPEQDQELFTLMEKIASGKAGDPADELLRILSYPNHNLPAIKAEALGLYNLAVNKRKPIRAEKYAALFTDPATTRTDLIVQSHIDVLGDHRQRGEFENDIYRRLKKIDRETPALETTTIIEAASAVRAGNESLARELMFVLDRNRSLRFDLQLLQLRERAFAAGDTNLGSEFNRLIYQERSEADITFLRRYLSLRKQGMDAQAQLVLDQYLSSRLKRNNNNRTYTGNLIIPGGAKTPISGFVRSVLNSPLGTRFSRILGRFGYELDPDVTQDAQAVRIVEEVTRERVTKRRTVTYADMGTD